MTRALVVGVGAIGGPVIAALASAGVRVRFCDDDAVELSNLQRQIQFTAADVGTAKVEAMATHLRARGVSDDRIDGRSIRFDADTADALLEDVDIAIDGSDNFATKFAVSDAATARGLPSIIASAVATSGQLFANVAGGPCYRCLFEAPPADDRGNCAQVGILAPLPGVVAGWTARITLDIGANTAPPATLAVFEHTATEPRWIALERRADCPAHPDSPNRNPDKGTRHGNRSNSHSLA